jgi:hypothetical protein
MTPISAKGGTSCSADRTNRIAPSAQAFQPFVASTFRLARSATIFASMYWRNILDVAREEQLQGMRARPMTLPSAQLDSAAPSIDGLEVVELTVLDISLAAAPR